MLPRIWIFDTYSICLIVGVLCCFLVLYSYFKKIGVKKGYMYDVFILGSFTILFGILSATLFQYVFDLLNGVNEFGAMTFYGGLIGGVIFFIVFYQLLIYKKYKEYPLMTIVIIAPACITVAHAFGRIGCFCDGCCYGIETDSFLGVKFPDLPNKVYPTQLFEAFFLGLLSVPLYLLAVKKRSIYTMPIYTLTYGVWRFMIEFIRGDERGVVVFGLHPAQIISILLVICGIILLIVFIKFRNRWNYGNISDNS